MTMQRTTLIGAAVAAALFGNIVPAYSQSGTAAKSGDVEEIVVTGIRGSIRESIDTKRESTAIVDAISAEDMGKFPDKNAAESLSHVPGVNIDRLFGQGERVSIRGTDPALNRTLLNGQTVATADWFILDNPGRTFNYTLLAPEIIERLEVYKTPEASMEEGSIGGTVILRSRRPLNLPSNTLRASVDYAYNDRAEEGNPNYSGLYSWKNGAETWGVLFTALHSEEDIERHGIETFSYPGALAAGFPAASVGNDPSVIFPNAINAALFKQERTRNSGTIGLQFRPSDTFELNLTGLYVKADYDNYNQSRYAFTGFATDSEPAPRAASATNVQVRNGIVSQATINNGFIQQDSLVRKSEVEVKAVDLRADWKGEGWEASGTVGTTEADGGTQNQYFVSLTSNAAYTYRVGKERAEVDYLRIDPTNPATLNRFDSASWRQQPTHDEEQYIQGDFAHDLDWGAIKKWRVGAKYKEHQTTQEARLANVAASSGVGVTGSSFAAGVTPGGFLDGLDVSQGLDTWRQMNPSAVEAYIRSARLVNPNNSAKSVTGLVATPNAAFDVSEDITALYTQFDFDGQGFRGNLGLRYVQTEQESIGAITSGESVTPNNFSKKYKDWLPSFNMAFDLADNVILRLGASRSMARPNFSDIASFVNLQDNLNSGQGGRPELDPYRASNFDVSGEWYFSKDGLLSAALFYKDIRSFIVSKTQPEQQFNTLRNRVETYQITRPINGKGGEIQGVELGYQNVIVGNFGIQANYTYSDGSTDDGLQLPFSSKHTVNLTPYYDDGRFNARVTYGWRSQYFREIGRNGVAVTTDDYAQLDFAAGFRLTDNFELTAQILNALDETHYDFAGDENRPLDMYKNGRRYFVGVRYSL